MRVTSIDPRDQGWEDTDPRYRVYFHDADGASDEYELSGIDVDEVLAWADANKGGRGYVLYACTRTHGVGLIRLQGHDPNEAATR